MYEQLSIFDIEQKKTVQADIFPQAFNLFHEFCRHRGWHKEATETEPSMWMCGCPNGHLARGWSDWVPCTVENCYLKNKGEQK